jgi:hypothetical protein
LTEGSSEAMIERNRGDKERKRKEKTVKVLMKKGA